MRSKSYETLFQGANIGFYVSSTCDLKKFMII